MWIFLKIISVCLGFIYRFTSRNSFGQNKYDNGRIVDGITCYVDYDRSYHGFITRTYFIIKFESKCFFKISLESKFDKMFKEWGLADEVQTGDLLFDRKVYIASDNFHFRQQIKDNYEIRNYVKRIFEYEADSITSDGKVLLAVFARDRTQDELIFRYMCSLFKEVIKEKDSYQKSSYDPYNKRFLLVESIIWSTAIYAVISFFQYTTQPDIYLDHSPIVWAGLFFTLAIGTIVFYSIKAFLKGTSRAHRILLESAIVLILSLPIASISLVSDININFDTSKSIMKEAVVLEAYSRFVQGRYSHRTKYYIDLADREIYSTIILPRRIEVSANVYRLLSRNSNIRIELGKGFLGQKWIRSIQKE